jgi:hypothetical protein
MAKENKNQKKEQAAPVVASHNVSSENAMDFIRKSNLVSILDTKQVKEQILKEEDERKQMELKRVILKASYRRLYALLQVRARRRESDITLDKLKKAEVLEDLVAGFILSEDKIKKHGGEGAKLTVGETTYELKEGEEIWVPAQITVNEYRDKERELTSDTRKKMNESDTQLSKEIAELRTKYPSYYSYDWDW